MHTSVVCILCTLLAGTTLVCILCIILCILCIVRTLASMHTTRVLVLYANEYAY